MTICEILTELIERDVCFQNSMENYTCNPHLKVKFSQDEKKTETVASSEGAEEVCPKMCQLPREGARADEGDSSDEEEASTNYNTIASLAALKDLLQGDAAEAPEADSFFQHYFMNHCNNLSSRNSTSPFPFPERRRLSECREEDEDEEGRKEVAGHWSKPVECTVMGAKHKFRVTTMYPPPERLQRALGAQPHSAHTVHFSTRGAEELKPHLRSIFPGQNLHRDRKFFDSSLIEIRSSADSVSAPSTNSEDIWVKRTPPKQANPEAVVDAAPTIEKDEGRPRSGTWGAEHSTGARKKEVPPPSPKAKSSKPKTRALSTADEVEPEAGFTRSSPSVGGGARRGFDDDTPQQITIHGTSGVSKRPASYDVFRRGSVGNSAFMKNVRSAWQSVAYTPTKPALPSISDESVVPHKLHSITAAVRADGSAHPLAGSDECYHTITANNARKSGGAMSRVRDLFRKQDSNETRKTKTTDGDSTSTRSSASSTLEPCRKSSQDSAMRPRSNSDSKKAPTVSKQNDQPSKSQQAMKEPKAGTSLDVNAKINAKKAAKPSIDPVTPSTSRQQPKKSGTNGGAETSTGKSPNAAYNTMARVKALFRRQSVYTPADVEARRKRALAQHRQLKQASANLRRAAAQDAEKRRYSLDASPRHLHRASDAAIDPSHAAILFRDSRGLPVADPFLAKAELSDLQKDESQIFVKFFKFHSCYDLIPTSAKLVVFDTELLVKKAFFALVDNGVRAAPLWDSKRQLYVGMLTITDFIKILQMYYTSPDVAMDELEEHRLGTWARVLKGSVMPLVSIGPNESLFEAIRMLISNRIHRLPIIDPDTGDCLYILTHKRILRFLFLYIKDLPKPAYLQCKLRELSVGTFGNIETATEETSIIEALKKFVNRRVSALPLIDEDGRLKDIYAKFDVINLAAEKTYNNLDVTLKKANEHRNEWFEGVQKCTLDETLYEVMDRIVRAEVHRLVVVDEEDKVIGIISLSDLLSYLVLRPCGGEETRTRDEARALAACTTTDIPEEDEQDKPQPADSASRSPSPNTCPIDPPASE